MFEYLYRVVSYMLNDFETACEMWADSIF